MDAQLTYNLIDKAEKQGKFPGLRVGSLEEINNNAGNWGIISGSYDYQHS